MKTRKLGWHVIFTLMLGAAFVYAEEEKIVKEQDRVEYKKQTVIDFNDFLVTGDLLRPDGSYVKNRRRSQFEALIEMRANFRPELLQSTGVL